MPETDSPTTLCSCGCGRTRIGCSIAPMWRFPNDPPGIDPTTSDMPPVTAAAERTNEFIKWFGDGRVYVDPDEIGPPLYTRDMEALTRLVTRPAATPKALVALLTEHEYRWTTHGNARPYDVIHCAGDCDWRLRQKALMSDDYVVEQHRQHVAEQIAALILGGAS